MIHLNNDLSIHNNINLLPTWQYFHFQKYFTLWQQTNDLSELEEVLAQVINYIDIKKDSDQIRSFIINTYESQYIAKKEVSYAYYAFYSLLLSSNNELKDIRYISKEQMYEFIDNNNLSFESICENLKSANRSIRKQSVKYKYTSTDKSQRHSAFVKNKVLGVDGSSINDYLENSALAIDNITDYFLKQHVFMELSADDDEQSEYNWEGELLQSFSRTYNVLGYNTDELLTLSVVSFFEKYDEFLERQLKEEAIK